jgi:ring-1,2-phenylacetyl-CoA epoxidase subunit PaaD
MHVDPDLAPLEAALAVVEDPEIPGLTLMDLGILRSVRRDKDGVHVGIAPTYTGCPATDVIAERVREAALGAGFDARIDRVLSPPWSSDDITAHGRERLSSLGISPPQFGALSPQALAGPRDGVSCPRCSSHDTRLRSAFGSTPCKALYQCSSCEEPFEYFKCL